MAARLVSPYPLVWSMGLARAGVGCQGAVSDQVLAGSTGWARLGSPVDGGGRVRNGSYILNATRGVLSACRDGFRPFAATAVLQPIPRAVFDVVRWAGNNHVDGADRHLVHELDAIAGVDLTVGHSGGGSPKVVPAGVDRRAADKILEVSEMAKTLDLAGNFRSDAEALRKAREEAIRIHPTDISMDSLMTATSSRVAKLKVPRREEYLVFCGPLDSIMSFYKHVGGRWGQSPNIWWPEDRAWCVATEIDSLDTYIGGSKACIERVLGRPDLEALPIGLGARVDASGDTINV